MSTSIESVALICNGQQQEQSGSDSPKNNPTPTDDPATIVEDVFSEEEEESDVVLLPPSTSQSGRLIRGPIRSAGGADSPPPPAVPRLAGVGNGTSGSDDRQTSAGPAVPNGSPGTPRPTTGQLHPLDDPDDGRRTSTSGGGGGGPTISPLRFRRFFSTGNLLSRLRAGPSSPTLILRPLSGTGSRRRRRSRYTSEGQSQNQVPVRSDGGGTDRQISTSSSTAQQPPPAIQLPHVHTVAGFDAHNHPLTHAHGASSRKVRKYYKRQVDLLKNYEADQAAVTEWVTAQRQRRLSSQKSTTSGGGPAVPPPPIDPSASGAVLKPPSQVGLSIKNNIKNDKNRRISDDADRNGLLSSAEDGLIVSFTDEPDDDGVDRTQSDEAQKSYTKDPSVIVLPAPSAADDQPHKLTHRRSSDDAVALLEDGHQRTKTSDHKHSSGQAPRTDRHATRLAQISLAANVVLMALKVAATALTGSYAIISSMVDSVVDLTSGFVIWLTNRAIEKRDPYLYPRGRTRLEPLALVIISVVMGVASVMVGMEGGRQYVIMKSAEAIAIGDVQPQVDLISISFMIITILVKLGLFAACHRQRQHPSVSVLAQDHRNDCISNSVAVSCAIAGYHWWPYVDPIGAILVSLYIIATWCGTGYGQVKMLSGRTADAEFINRVLKICLEHDDAIQAIDTVLVYHFGTKFLVEVHIVLDERMSIRQAHDIQEPLQNKIECLDYVERAFVHVDYEFEHRAEDEHKVV